MAADEFYDRVDYDAIQISMEDWTLAHGTVTFCLPPDWELTERMFDYAVYDIAGNDDVELMFKIEAFEDEERVATNDLGGFFELPVDEFNDPEDFDIVRRDDGSVDWSQAIIRRLVTRIDRKTGEPYAKAGVWRCINVLPPSHIRILTIVLSYPLDRKINEFALLDDPRALVFEVLHELIREVKFSPQLTTLDRTASTPDLETQWFDDVAAIRLPRGWKWDIEPDNNQALPLYAFDSPKDDEWTFWVQLVTNPVGHSEAKVASELVEKFLDGLFDNAALRRDFVEEAKFRDPEDPTIGYSRVVSFETEDGVRLRRTSWQVIKVGAHMTVMAILHWVVIDGIVDEPGIRAITDLLEREVPSTVILPDLAAALYG